VRISVWAAIWTIAMVFAPWQAGAETLEKLLMPGKVISAHAKYEDKCETCHEPFSKTSQRRLCLDCHKKVAADVERKVGFHGRHAAVGGVECKHCHTEHVGRDADVVGLDRETFDHHQTDFVLKGAHTRVRCSLCHVEGKTYREAPSQCVACHKDSDPHKGRLGKKCEKCHDSRNWREVRFDHDRTDFRLTGKHREIACTGCHLNQRYEDAPTRCAACHRLNDAHGGRYGDKCETCHSAEKWKSVSFDHDRDTKFRLEGAHRKATCAACHSAPLYQQKLGTACLDCHRNDDAHKGRYGPKCQTCHNVEAWKRVRFDHDKDTKFRLRGRHAKLTCAACHKGDVYKEELSTECQACHRQDDVHKGQEGVKCQSCHNEQDWTGRVFFEHDLTRFPLIGLHATVPCEACHLTAAYKDAALECVSCHKPDDVHKRRLGPACAQCHNPNGWNLWRFDHDKQTDYVLDGAHKELACKACHRTQVERKIELSKTCNSCHQRDDIHRGNFGRQCEQCHVTRSFREINVRR